MKNIRILPILLLGILVLLSSCGPKDELLPWVIVSTSSEKSKTELMEGQLLSAMPLLVNYQQHAYQYQRANSIDVYAGYFTVSQNNFLFGGPLESTYTFPNPYYAGAMNLNPVAIQVNDAYKNAEALGVPEWKAIAMILYGYSAHEVTDMFGPIPFDDYRNLKENPPIKYERMDTVYFKILRELRQAVVILKDRKPSAEQLRKVEGQNGGLSRGDWRMWVKFANSIRLRMAMNMVKVEPQRAREEAESAVNDEIGVLQYGDKDIAFDEANTGSKTDNPLYFICVLWDDLRLGASLENILKRYNSPLLDKWFSKNPYQVKDKNGMLSGFEANSDYFGIRQGVPMINKSNKQEGYGMFSTFKVQDLPRSYMKVTEVLFLRAEGALRGWNMGGTADELYYSGIKKCFDEFGLNDSYEDYIAQTTVKNVDYIDPYDRDNDIKGRVNVGVKWDFSDTKETMLEKIITQKYMANFPMGAEAWTTFRRTGYPRLFPVRINNWPTVDTELQLRRCPYRESEDNTNDLNTSFIESMGGPNTGGQRLWWDVPTETRDGNNWIVPHNID